MLELNDLFEQMQDTVKKSEISSFMLDFSKEEVKKEYLILNGLPAKADKTYRGLASSCYMSRKVMFINRPIESDHDLTTSRHNP